MKTPPAVETMINAPAIQSLLSFVGSMDENGKADLECALADCRSVEELKDLAWNVCSVWLDQIKANETLTIEELEEREGSLETLHRVSYSLQTSAWLGQLAETVNVALRGKLN